jgi:hypothetical protein
MHLAGVEADTGHLDPLPANINGGSLRGRWFRKPLIVKMPDFTRTDTLPPRTLYQPTGARTTNQCNENDRLGKPIQPESRILRILTNPRQSLHFLQSS